MVLSVPGVEYSPSSANGGPMSAKATKLCLMKLSS